MLNTGKAVAIAVTGGIGKRRRQQQERVLKLIVEEHRALVDSVQSSLKTVIIREQKRAQADQEKRRDAVAASREQSVEVRREAAAELLKK